MEYRIFSIRSSFFATKEKHIANSVPRHTKINAINILMAFICILISLVPHRAYGQTSDHVPEITQNDDGLYSIEVHGATLQSVTDVLRDKTNVQMFVRKEVRNAIISVNRKDLTLIDLVKAIAGDNYVLTFDDYGISSLHILNVGLEDSPFLNTGFPEFSGKIKVSKGRAKMFFIAEAKSDQAINNYISKRHMYLEYLEKIDPNREIQAQISFENYVSASELLAFVKDNNIRPLGLSIGSGEHGGGYELREQESLESALIKADKHHGEFVSTLLDDAESGQTDQDFIESTKKLSESYHQSGVKYYGIRGAGTVASINGMRSTDILRLADPLVGGSVEDELVQAYAVKKIGIPLQPREE